MSLIQTRIKKLTTALARPICWNALRLGVAPTIEHMPLLRKLAFDGIIDVGANRGQFSLACQLVKPTVPIVAFEPIPAEAKVFRRIHDWNKYVVLVQTALGEVSGEATLHLSGRADSSSLLPIGPRQAELFPSTAEVGTITVSVQRLDDLAELWPGRMNQLLKIDVQGSELSVLRGAVETLKCCRYVYAECSEETLYEGQALHGEVTEFLRECGFREQSQINPVFTNGELVQADYLYRRER